jgi:sigma-B regulation protein RsbU (phosphoserine phosphatase)
MTADTLLHGVLNTLEEGILLLDREGTVRFANTAALGLLGVEPEELLGQCAFDTFASGGLAESLRSDLATQIRHAAEGALFLRKNRPPLSVDYVLEFLPANGDDVHALLRFHTAVLPADSCDSALKTSEARLRVILDTIADAVVATDQKGSIQLFNPAAEKLFGYRRDEVIGCNVRILMPSPDHERHDEYIANYLRTGVRKIIGSGREVTGKRHDGTLLPLYLSIGETAIGGNRMFVAVLHDLTQRKRQEAQLMTLSSAVEQSPNAVLIIDAKGRIEYVNPGYCRITGYTQDEMRGRTPDILCADCTPEPVYRELWQCLEQGRLWLGEIEGHKKNGERYWALQSVSPIRNEQGEITQFLAIQQDITEIKKDKEALQESEERFRQIAEMAGEWLWEQDPEGRYIYSSSAVEAILGYTPEEILGKVYLDLLTPKDKAHWNAALEPLPDVRRRFSHLVNRYRHKDGREIFTESSGEPVFGSNGKLIKWRGVDHDVTARKHYEDALRLRDRAIEAASVGIEIADARATGYPNIYVNPALSRITGYARDELLGRSLRMLQGPDTDPAAVREIAESVRAGGHCEVVLKNYRKDGTPFWNSLLIAPVHDESGELTHYIGVQTDVTELRRASEERHELEIAKQIQLSLLPKKPLLACGLEVAGACIPASHVGGDYFDYFFAGNNLDVVIADVSGHSVGAALIMAEARSALKAAIRQATESHSSLGAGTMLCALNDLLHEDLNGADLFISMFYVCFDPGRRLLRYANAGHNRPLLQRQGNPSCRELDAEGMIFGVLKNAVFEERIEQLQAGDRLLLYTDGLTEAQNSAGEYFGVGRLCAAFAQLRNEPPQTVIQRLLDELRRFCGEHTFADDVTLVVLSVN